MTQMIMNVEVQAYGCNCFVELEGKSCRVWIDGTHPAFVGSIDDLHKALPQVFNALVAANYIKAS